jgi:invasion protein IalB
MKNAWRFGLSSLAGLILVGGALALPAAQSSGSQEPSSQAQAQTQTVSGKIASVERNSFTLTVGSGIEQSAQDPSTSSQSGRTMTFSIDKNTTVEGTLKVGSNADVTYRSDNGANVAISVHVTP